MDSIVKLVENQFASLQDVPLHAAFVQQVSAWLYNEIQSEEDLPALVQDVFFPENEEVVLRKVQEIKPDLVGKEPVPIPEFSVNSKKKAQKRSASPSPKIFNPLTGREIVLGGAAFKKYQKQGYFLADGTPTSKALEEAKVKEEEKAKTKAGKKKSPAKTAEEEIKSKFEEDASEGTEDFDEQEEKETMVPTESVALEEITSPLKSLAGSFPEGKHSPRASPSEEGGAKVLNPLTGKKIAKGGKLHHKLVKEGKLPSSSLN